VGVFQLKTNCKENSFISMIILQSTASAQDLFFIPREYVADTMIIKNETTNTEVSFAITPTISTYYMVVNEVLDLVQDTYYTLTIKNGTDIVYKDMIFCTNQAVTSYTVNNDEYIANDTTNDFIVV